MHNQRLSGKLSQFKRPREREGTTLHKLFNDFSKVSWNKKRVFAIWMVPVYTMWCMNLSISLHTLEHSSRKEHNGSICSTWTHPNFQLCRWLGGYSSRPAGGLVSVCTGRKNLAEKRPWYDMILGSLECVFVPETWRSKCMCIYQYAMF